MMQIHNVRHALDCRCPNCRGRLSPRAATAVGVTLAVLLWAAIGATLAVLL